MFNSYHFSLLVIFVFLIIKYEVEMTLKVSDNAINFPYLFQILHKIILALKNLKLLTLFNPGRNFIDIIHKSADNPYTHCIVNIIGCGMQIRF